MKSPTQVKKRHRFRTRRKLPRKHNPVRPISLKPPIPVVIAGTLSILGTTGNAAAGAAKVVVQRRADDTTVATTTTDAAGNFSLPVSAGGVPFDGYLTLTKDGLVSARLYISRPLTSSIQIGNISLLSSATLSIVHGLLGVQPTATGTTVIISVRDSALSAVHLRQGNIEVGSPLFYADASGLPSALKTSGGNSWALNVPPGPTEISASSNRTLVGPAQINAGQGRMTFVLLVP
jgi:hypothetical protein